MAAAANGWASGQIVLFAPEHAGLSNVRVSVSSLDSWKVTTDDNDKWELAPGASVPAAAFHLARVHYVAIDVPSPGRTSAPGLYPDPIEPLSSDHSFDVEAGTAQPIWVRLKVPPGTIPASFQARFTAEADVEGQGRVRCEIPIKLRVFGFRLPRQRILHIWSASDIGSLRAFYNWMSDEEVLRAWEDGAFLLASYGITPNTLPASWFGSEPDLDYYERFYRKILDLGAPHLEIVSESWPVIVKNNWEDIAYSYFASEWPKDQNPARAAQIREIIKQAPGVKVSVAGLLPDDWLIGLVKVWIHHLSGQQLHTLRERQRAGDEAWWHICCGPVEPYANMHLDARPTDTRVVGWQLYQYGCTGFYYWQASANRGNTDGTTPEEKWPHRAWCTGTSDVAPCHNDGQLIYPGAGGKAWSSIRLENMRDGAEDYDYLSILARYVRKLERAGLEPGLVRRATDALHVNPALSAGVTEYTQDPAVVEAERRRIGALIEEARVNLGEFERLVVMTQIQTSGGEE